MTYNKKLKYFLFIGLAVIIGQTECYSQKSLKERKIELIITAGAWLNAPSKIWVDDINDYTGKNVSALIKAMGDVYINPNFALGLYLNIGPGYSHKNISSDNTCFMFEYGAGFKPVFYFSEYTAIKIGADLGWRIHKSAYQGVDGHGLGVNCSIEIQHLIRSGNTLTFEPGFLSQPSGYADEDTKRYAYAPIFYLNIGFSFSVYGASG